MGCQSWDAPTCRQTQREGSREGADWRGQQSGFTCERQVGNSSEMPPISIPISTHPRGSQSCMVSHGEEDPICHTKARSNQMMLPP